MKTGSLMVVGSGIKSVGQLTLEAQGWITRADRVLYGVGDPVTTRWIRQANANCEDLFSLYGEDKRRATTYKEMAARILAPVRAGLDVCAVFYGHPGVIVDPSHLAIKLARQEGYRAGMLPAVSALDCLFADLGIDPGRGGCQTFEATDFLLYRRRLCTDNHVILWQIDVVGDPGFARLGHDARNLPILVDALQQVYGHEYEVVHYRAARYPMYGPCIDRLPLSRLTPAMVATQSTLYIPPKDAAPIDQEMAARLGFGGGTRSPDDGAHMDRPHPTRDAVETGRLADFITALSQDPLLLARYRRDPRTTIAWYGGLTQAESDALLSDRSRAIL